VSVPLDPGVAGARDPLLIAAWDANVDVRAHELAGQGDLAYCALTELVLRLLEENVPAGAAVLDAGCGLGYLSGSMAETGYKVAGIDPSGASIDYANHNFYMPSFYLQSIEDHASAESEVGIEKYGAIVANMVLHATPDLRSFMRSAVALLEPGGVFIATIPHPCFFLGTKDSLSMQSKYSDGVGLLIPFQIYGRPAHPEQVPYFQRTISEYSDQLYLAGFRNVRILEPRNIGPGRMNDILAIHASKPDK
jgi:SAM-dependent methyltransferase